ncbi:TPM domain-containing protein [Trinickia sp. LjRoot230]|uniref:TPM domain-containing protein n=1 Tax=Trinickia sp. LjRoot230 TaxID=3342288 RepID=UPI003ED11735
MNLTRIIRHLFMTRWRVASAFPKRALNAIEKAVRESHQAHIGQVQFAVEGALHSGALLSGKSARERAIEVFSELRVWDTEHNNGVLIYLLLADRDVEIVADRGIHARVGADEWEVICREMEAEFRRGQYESGAVSGIRRVTALLARHFPAPQPERDELPTSPSVLRS